MLEQVANEICIVSDILQTNNVTRIAKELSYQPLIIMNALQQGMAEGKFVYKPKKDTVDVDKGVELDKLSVTDGTKDLGEQIAYFMIEMNSRKQDLWINRLTEFVPGTSEMQIKLAVYTNDNVTMYDLKNPYDKKSTYTFITRAENVDQQWGSRQFVKPEPKKKK